MNENQKGMTRSELLRGGLIGLTALAALPLAASCAPKEPEVALEPEPEERYEPAYTESGQASRPSSTSAEDWEFRETTFG